MLTVARPWYRQEVLEHWFGRGIQFEDTPCLIVINVCILSK